jgi:hypothetical protein
LLWEIWNHIEANTYILLGKTLIFSGLVTIPPLAPNSFFQGFLLLFDPPQRRTIYVRLGFGIWNIFLRFLQLCNQTRWWKKYRKKYLFNYYINPFIFTTTCLQACSCSFAQLHNQCLATKPVCGEPILQSVFFSARKECLFFLHRKEKSKITCLIKFWHYTIYMVILATGCEYFFFLGKECI